LFLNNFFKCTFAQKLNLPNMNKKIFSFLFSTRLMAFLFIAFAAAMGTGTFIEDAYNTDTARILIYNTWWFEAILLIFMINFFGNIKRYQLHKKEKWATLVLHLSFILIILGAFITRYISYEGMMPIREGAIENQFFSDKTYLTIFVDGEYKGEMKRRVFEKSLLLSPVTNNDFSISDKFDETPFEVTYENYVMGAKEKIKPTANGTLYLKLVEAGAGGREEHFLKEGEVQNIHNVLFALNKPTDGAININTTGEKYTIQTPFEGEFMRMADKLKGTVTKDNVQPLMMRSLYSIGDIRIVFPDPAVKGIIDYESNNDYKAKSHHDALIVKVKADGQEKEVRLLGSKGSVGEPQTVKIGKIEYSLFYGSKAYILPFKIKLNDFIAKKYPGTEKSYSSFESQVTVQDAAETFNARIYMNHILDYKGYRFFQSSFDPDEKGTVLSVNHDFWGTTITYIGYALLYLGMLFILIDKNSRFGDLKKKLKKIKMKKANLTTILLIFFSISTYSQNHLHTKPSQIQIESFLKENMVSKEHAGKFGRLVIQDEGGRMKPINTFSSELLRKVSQSDTYNDMSSDQVFLSMTQFPEIWYQVPIVYLNTKNDSIRNLLGISKGVKLVRLIDFFGEKGNYKLASKLNDAFHEGTPDAFQKDIIDTDKKVNLLYSALSGQILKIFPKPNDKNNKWVSYLEIHQSTNSVLDTVKNILPFYLNSVLKSAKNNDYKLPNSLLIGLENYQKKYGSAVRPSDKKIESEILYNKLDVFQKLFSWYMYASLLMLLFVIINIFNSGKIVKVGVTFFHVIIALLFALHTTGLISRWYISGHAPWSNAYESMIYVAWATMLFALLFAKKSKLTVAAGTFVAAIILFIAHKNWLDPEIANLQPVLDSYWLMIHVAVIVASYGPLTLGMVLGVLSLILMIFSNEKNKEKISLNIKEITYINEMSITIGLVMLTIGNFLGGQWANESWGRYWGWDPKETWALVSIMVYAFIIHMRLVPGLRTKWIFNLMTIIGFYSIMMTYFGVNFYLSGLHSYASGGKIITPSFVYYLLFGTVVLGGLSYFKHKKHLVSPKK
jgi:cytochrome c-type biogenesis protein CcsB